MSVDEIAEKLGCHRWLVCRGVERSGCDRGYDAEIAQRVCDERAERPKLVSESEIAERVREVIKKGWSPQAIAADLRQYRKSRHRRVCAETIYRACYDHTGRSGPAGRPAGGSCPEGAANAKPEAASAYHGVFPDRCVTSQIGPSLLLIAANPGTGKADLIIGKNNRSAVVTLIKRSSRFTLLAALPDGYNADATAEAVTAALRRIPQDILKSSTWDQGREMARRQRIESDTGVEVFFCDPHSPWQRPSNEHNNAVLRRRLPAGVVVCRSGWDPATSTTTPSYAVGCLKAPTST